MPAPLVDQAELARAVEVLAAGHGPVAVDAERASGYRYGQRAYLVQLRRADLGTVLVDPRALPDLSALGAAIAGDEWVLHAASQDLPVPARAGHGARAGSSTPSWPAGCSATRRSGSARSSSRCSG